MKRVITLDEDQSIGIIDSSKCDINHVYLSHQLNTYYILICHRDEADSIFKYHWQAVSNSRHINENVKFGDLPFMLAIREMSKDGQLVYEFDTPKELFTWLGEQL